MAKTTEEIAAEEAAQKAHREELARAANKKSNEQLLEARNAIADQADRVKNDADDLEDLTDEVWAQEDGGEAPKKKTRAELEAEQDEEEIEDEAAQAKLLRQKEKEDRDLDEVREAGADDVREREDGTREYRLLVNGKALWLTLEQLRETAGQVVDDKDALQDDQDGATRRAAHAPTPADLKARREAEEQRQAEQSAAYKARLKDLYTRASMGDEQAIDELAEIQAGLSRVTPDVLRIVNEQVDARVMGRTAFEKAVAWFEGEYADELSTPRLKAYAARRDKELATENPDQAPRERLKAVGDEMRQLRQDLGGARREKTPETKLQRKRSAPQVPTAAGRTRPAAEEDETESTQDAIRRMAQSRGQGRAIKH